MFENAASDEEKRAVISALNRAKSMPATSTYPNDLLELVITDATRIADFFVNSIEGLSYELKESLEHDYLYEHNRILQIANDEEDRLGCRNVAKRLIQSIIKFRDKLNTDTDYVRYKTLVGFESVFPQHWENLDVDFQKIDTFRDEEAAHFIDQITLETADEWLAFIETCASTESNDLATFPTFGKFLVELARRKPDIARNFLERAGDNLLKFLPALLNGLFQSARTEIYLEQFTRFLNGGAHLQSLVIHWRASKPSDSALIVAVLHRAIEVLDDVAVMQCLLLAIEHFSSTATPPKEVFFTPALVYLNSRKEARWVRGAWFAHKHLPIFETITKAEAQLLLKNLLQLPAIDYNAEKILSQIAQNHRPLVWDYLGRRLERREKKIGNERYEAIPYGFHELHTELSKDIKLAVSSARSWYDRDPRLFRFSGGRILHGVFPKFEIGLSDELCELVGHGSDTDADFVLEIMQNYHGEPTTHETLKCLVIKYPDDRSKHQRISISFDSTGVVTGEFGYVEAMRQKKTAMASWLTDNRPEVRSFAEGHIRDLDLTIADEQRRAEERRAIRRMQFDQDDEDNKDDE
jgi:hypothetical protein